MAIYEIAKALRKQAPAVLADLRDRPNRAGDVAAWAAEHYLESPVVTDYVGRLRQYWSEWPAVAADLEVVGFTTVKIRADNTRYWYDEIPEHMRGFHFPAPEQQTLADWLDSARYLYLERQRVTGSYQPYRQWSRFKQHCEWFVDVQVLGCNPSTLARRLDRDHAAVDRETKKIASVLGVARRTWRRGRPKGKM